MSTDTAIDFDAYYRVEGWGGIACHLVGYAKTTREPEAELVCEDEDCEHEEFYCWSMPDPFEEDDTSFVRAIMVGDDTVHLIDVEDLRPLAREEFCGECGQIGCTHDGLDRG